MATKKRGARAGQAGVAEVRERLWRAVEAAAAIVDDSRADPALRLRAVHGVTQASQAYVKVVESHEFERRLAALEDAADTLP